MIKPDNVSFADAIIEELDKHAERVKYAEVDSVLYDIIAEHYSVHKNKPFYEYIINSFVDKKVVVVVYEGEDVINKLVGLIGDTDLILAHPCQHTRKVQ